MSPIAFKLADTVGRIAQPDSAGASPEAMPVTMKRFDRGRNRAVDRPVGVNVDTILSINPSSITSEGLTDKMLSTLAGASIS